MTREEAVAIVIDRHKKLSFSEKLDDADFREIAECDVDNFVALGMLTLSPQESASE